MATLNYLAKVLKQVKVSDSCQKMPISDEQYSSGFDILLRGSEWGTYREFIIPHLSIVITSLLSSRDRIAVLEIGPGPISVLGDLPGHLREKVGKYAAFEPNHLFAASIKSWLNPTSELGSPLPSLQSLPEIHRMSFSLHSERASTGACGKHLHEKFDVIIFCHSMYGMEPKTGIIEQAVEMLVEKPSSGLVIVFHRDGLRLHGLACHQTATFPSGTVCVTDNDQVLDCFASFVTGFTVDEKERLTVQDYWRRVPSLFQGENVVKNREASSHQPASVVRPKSIREVQLCVRWAIDHQLALTIIGGGHSGHCQWPNVVAIDMSAFDQMQIVATGEGETGCNPNSGPLMIVGAGCKSGEIVRETMKAGITVPLGSRPSVGAGLWLQGGIGHLSRLYGLACHVPSQYRPADAVMSENEDDLLWAIKGAGTNFGIIISVTFRTFEAPIYCTRNWVLPMKDASESRHWLSVVDRLARNLPHICSVDAYLYGEADQIQLGVTMFECVTNEITSVSPLSAHISTVLGPENSCNTVDSVELFEAEMYMSKMHGGHGGGKTSSFKRCAFLKNIDKTVAETLLKVIEARPTPLCYLHLLHGGAAVQGVPANATAFGCRDWNFACVITGVWPREEDHTEPAQAAVAWVYRAMKRLMPLSCGVYSADLGPDPRDKMLAATAFGQNGSELARLKQKLDPHNVLAYACPHREAQIAPKLIILVTGESGAGKDYCADVWASLLDSCTQQNLTVRKVSISDATKREYAMATGADFDRLHRDREYKEQHRPELTRFFKDQVRHRPQLPEEHFSEAVNSAADVHVLLITGMRDEAPVSAFSHLVPASRLIDIRVRADERIRRIRRGCCDCSSGYNGTCAVDGEDESSMEPANYCPSFLFDNDKAGSVAVEKFARTHLLPFFDDGFQRLADMVRPVSNFPRLGVDFRHVLNICQQQGGLVLCSSVMRIQFIGDWNAIHSVVCCEVGGFVFASALATHVDRPLALIRKAGKLPPPTVSVLKSTSHISSSVSSQLEDTWIEMDRDLIRRDVSVVVVDDVLATGKTLCAVLQLLEKANVSVKDISIMVVAEFPIHRGRELLRQHGYGGIRIQSLLVFEGA
ncbi:hypothetical protein N7481_001602 [Penicillium waksmanii]|uniref:uncharacterized protein n=1 Tax=Penicillium waksmanii TaxID=69791 RepID=UPI00254929DA|nr:uncharacterized protein N7481_001602 [Penicillium waksmanii]KAJ6001193.1 hypothetical protein N7481_001602 [Penicillium waksmanii]